jgi:hypothetical protein
VYQQHWNVVASFSNLSMDMYRYVIGSLNEEVGALNDRLLRLHRQRFQQTYSQRPQSQYPESQFVHGNPPFHVVVAEGFRCT